MIKLYGQKCLFKSISGVKSGLLYTDSEYNATNKRKTGLLPNASIESTLLNTCIRQINICEFILFQIINKITNLSEDTMDSTGLEQIILKFVDYLNKIQYIINGVDDKSNLVEIKNSVNTNSALYCVFKNGTKEFIGQLMTNIKNELNNLKLQLTREINDLVVGKTLNYVVDNGNIKIEMGKLQDRITALKLYYGVL